MNETLAAKVYYAMATASARTAHVTVGDIIISINNEMLFTIPNDGNVPFVSTDEFFDSVRSKIVETKAPRVVRFIRYYRNIYRGRIVAPRDAKLNHVEASFLFDKDHLLPVATFNVGEAEPTGTDDEDARLKSVRESGATSVVFDVTFPDTESLGINLWPNLLMWSSALGATDNKPVIQQNTRRLRPSEFAGAALSVPPIVRQASSSSSSWTERTPLNPVDRRIVATSTDRVERERTESPTINPWEDIRTSASATPWVEPLLARHGGRQSQNTDTRNDAPENFPRPSQFAGQTLSVPTMLRATPSRPAAPSTPSRLLPPTAGASGGANSGGYASAATGGWGLTTALTPTPTGSSESAATLSPSHASSSSSSETTQAREEDLQRCYTGQDRLVRPSEMKGAALSVPPIVGLGRVMGAIFGMSPVSAPVSAPSSAPTSPTKATTGAATSTATTGTDAADDAAPGASAAGSNMETNNADTDVVRAAPGNSVNSSALGPPPSPPPATASQSKRLTFKGLAPPPPAMPQGPGSGYPDLLLSSKSDGSGSGSVDVVAVAALSLTDFGDFGDFGEIDDGGIHAAFLPYSQVPGTPDNDTWKRVGSDDDGALAAAKTPPPADELAPPRFS